MASVPEHTAISLGKLSQPASNVITSTGIRHRIAYPFVRFHVALDRVPLGIPARVSPAQPVQPARDRQNGHSARQIATEGRG